VGVCGFDKFIEVSRNLFAQREARRNGCLENAPGCDDPELFRVKSKAFHSNIHKGFAFQQ